MTLATGANVSLANGDEYAPQMVSSITAAAGTTLKLAGGIWGFNAANYNFGGQIVLGTGAFSFVQFVNADGTLAPA